jgi:hypothetical protein
MAALERNRGNVTRAAREEYAKLRESVPMNQDLPEWRSAQSDPTETTIVNLVEELGTLPADYLAFLRRGGAGEGVIGKTYLVLWRAEELIERNRGYEVSIYTPGMVLFGSDGGGEAYGFDLRRNPAPVMMVAYDSMSWDESVEVGNTFAEFMERLAKGFDPQP